MSKMFSALGLNATTGAATAGMASSAVTLFAPTDLAWATFMRTYGLTIDDLLADKETLLQLVNYHMLGTTAAGRAPIAFFTLAKFSIPLATLNGQLISPQKNQ